MCVECGRYKCPGGCPNAPEPAFAGICAECGGKIINGDLYADTGGRAYHTRCLAELRFADLLNALGAEVHTANTDINGLAAERSF